MRTLTLAHLPAGQVCTYAHWQYTHHTERPSLHDHDFHELFWVEEGEGLQVVNGERRPLIPGLLVLARADDAHGFAAARPGGMVRFINFAFPRGLWNELWTRRLGRRPVFYALKDHRAREWTLDAAELDRLRVLGRDLAAGARDALTTEAFLAGVISLLANRDGGHERGRPPAWLTDSLAAMQEPRRFARGTREFARMAGCTPEHLARAARRHLGKTPTEIVNEARLAYAAQQLCTTERPLLDIVADCGLENLGHFYKLFRVRYGDSPERYRRRAFLPANRGG